MGRCYKGIIADISPFVKFPIYILFDFSTQASTASMTAPRKPFSSNTVASVKTGNQNLDPHQDADSQSTLVMANVKSALNVRSEANEDADKVGKLYKDCGGLILERRDGWTKLS